jgi:hypothetical protein
VFLTKTLCQNREVLKLNWNQPRLVTGPHVVHCHLKGHLSKMVFTNNPTREKRQPHIPCVTEAVACLRFRQLGHYFMEPGDYQNTPVRNYTSSEVLDCWKDKTGGGGMLCKDRWDSTSYFVTHISKLCLNFPVGFLCNS